MSEGFWKWKGVWVTDGEGQVARSKAVDDGCFDDAGVEQAWLVTVLGAVGDI